MYQGYRKLDDLFSNQPNRLLFLGEGGGVNTPPEEFTEEDRRRNESRKVVGVRKLDNGMNEERFDDGSVEWADPHLNHIQEIELVGKNHFSLEELIRKAQQEDPEMLKQFGLMNKENYQRFLRDARNTPITGPTISNAQSEALNYDKHEDYVREAIIHKKFKEYQKLKEGKLPFASIRSNFLNKVYKQNGHRVFNEAKNILRLSDFDERMLAKDLALTYDLNGAISLLRRYGLSNNEISERLVNYNTGKNLSTAGSNIMEIPGELLAKWFNDGTTRQQDQLLKSITKDGGNALFSSAIGNWGKAGEAIKTANSLVNLAVKPEGELVNHGLDYALRKIVPNNASGQFTKELINMYAKGTGQAFSNYATLDGGKIHSNIGSLLKGKAANLRNDLYASIDPAEKNRVKAAFEIDPKGTLAFLYQKHGEDYVTKYIAGEPWFKKWYKEEYLKKQG